MPDVQPHALHIGFSKCASTYLRALLRGNPSVFLVFKSGFFTPFLNREMTFDGYQSLFEAAGGRLCVESDEHLTLPNFHPELGVRTTDVGEFEAVAERIRSLLPNVKILMIIRNQASLIVSRYSEYLISGGSLGFEEFASKLMGADGTSNRYYQNYYFRILQILEARFPPQNLLLLLQEEMRADTEGVAARIAAFLGLPGTLELRKGMLSERRSLSMAGMSLLASVNRLLVRKSGVAGAPADTRIPYALYRNLSRAIRGLDYWLLARLSQGSSALLTAERRRKLLAGFSEDNANLQARLGRDLVKLGYLSG